MITHKLTDLYMTKQNYESIIAAKRIEILKKFSIFMNSLKTNTAKRIIIHYHVGIGGKYNVEIVV